MRNYLYPRYPIVFFRTAFGKDYTASCSRKLPTVLHKELPWVEGRIAFAAFGAKSRDQFASTIPTGSHPWLALVRTLLTSLSAKENGICEFSLMLTQSINVLPPLCMIISVTEKSSGLAVSNPKRGSDSLSRLAALVPLLTGTNFGDSDTCNLPA